MGARFVRAVTSAVLFATLFVSARAFAAPLQTVHLEPSRLFSPGSETLLSPLDGEIRAMSFLSQSLFNLSSINLSRGTMGDLLMPATQAPAVSGVNLPEVAHEQTYVPQIHTAYVPASDIPAPPDDALTQAAQAAPSVESLSSTVAPTFPRVHFGAYSAYSPAVQSLAANASVPMRVGKVHFNGMMEGAGHQSLQSSDAFRALQICGTTDENAACPYLRDSETQSLLVGTDFNVRAGNDNVNLALSSTVAHLSTGAAAIFPYVPIDPDSQLSANFNPAGPDASVLQYSGLSDVVKTGLGAAVAVPVNKRITVGLQYDHSHYQGDYTNSLIPGLDAYKDTYLGNVTYQLPNTNSLLTLSARQYRYQDSLSNFNLTQTRADLNFTVKF